MRLRSAGPAVRATSLVATACALLAPAAARAEEKFAPPNRPGQPLSEPAAALAASIDCSANPEAGRKWVLLIHGTGANSDINWSWNHIPALDALGIPWCTVDLPVGGSGDLQLNAEYVVNAIRVVYQRSGRRIGIIGHSQGGMSPRWVLRFWPDTREMVDDLVGYAPPNHGSQSANATCDPNGSCSPSSHQYRTDSLFNAALNSFTETFAGISYTNVYSHADFIATPNQDDSGTSSLHTGKGLIANIAIQDICPAQTTEHLGLAYDAVAWALAYDAITRDGPAVEARVPASVCAELVMPGVNRATFAADVARAVALYVAAPGAPEINAEPALRCYTLAAGCRRLRAISRRLVLGDHGIPVRLKCTDAEGRRCAARARVRRAGRTLAVRKVRLRAGRKVTRRLPPSRAGRRMLNRGRAPRTVLLELRSATGVVQKRLGVRIAR
jgi:triacylglycerol esterase/lipase EstA (alpha/beta hydrolase family)